jgi:hypothetical protein
MSIKRFILASIILFSVFGSIFAIDYSIYKYEQFNVPRGNPAYLMIPGGKATEGSLIKIEGNKWVVPLGPFWYVTLSQSLLDKIIMAKNNNDNFILFYQRRGNYVDISRYTGTNDPDLIRSDRQGQMEYIEATAKAYTFVADEVLTYSEIMTGVSRDIQNILLIEENRNEENGGLKIFLSFVNGQMTGARNYANNRSNEIQTARNTEAARRLEVTNREDFLNNATVSGGYKPVFRDRSLRWLSQIVSYDKIVVLGSYSGNQIRPTNLAENIYPRNSDVILSDFSNRWRELPSAGREYPIYFFLSKSENGFVLVRFEFYYDSIRNEPPPPYPQIKPDIYDGWIIKNADN